MIRPLFWATPEDSALWSVTDQFLLGDDVLGAPIVEQGATERSVVLPAGDWVHGPTGSVYAGSQTVTIEAPIGAPPVFARAETDVAAALVQAFSE